jgi:RNA polymerase sigma-70 factor (ECF subfamily)
MTVSADDGKLVRRCLAGDATSLRAFVERFQNAVFGLCLRMLGHRQDAEDISQEVFLRAFRSLKSWDSQRPLEPWVLTIAANRCRTLLSTRARKVQPLPENELPGSPEKSGADLGEELNRALAKLREEYRLCFELYHVQELPLAEIAEIVGSPEGTIKTWLFRARRELATYLRDRGLSPVPHEQG